MSGGGWVVVPCYQEALRLELDAFARALERDASTVLLFVDDGSTDSTFAKAASLAEHDHRLRVIRFRLNYGQTPAMAAGIDHAYGIVIVTMDGDLQNDPRDIPRLLAALDEHDAAVGYRTERREPWSRRVASRVANAVRNRLTGDDIIDTGCSLKAFRRECLLQLKMYRGMHRFLPTLLRIDGRRVVQLAVGHRPRRAGRSKYGIANRLIEPFVDLLVVRWMKKRRLEYKIEGDDGRTGENG